MPKTTLTARRTPTDHRYHEPIFSFTSTLPLRRVEAAAVSPSGAFAYTEDTKPSPRRSPRGGEGLCLCGFATRTREPLSLDAAYAHLASWLFQPAPTRTSPSLV